MINIKKVSEKIKKNEGYSNTIYYDKLGNATIGYGHLIKKNEKFTENKKYQKRKLNDLFKKDLSKAIKDYNKLFIKDNLPKRVSEVLVEMIFQLGLKNFLTFKKMIKAIKKKNYILASKEMKKSIWYKQTPLRVLKLSKTMGRTNDK